MYSNKNSKVIENELNSMNNIGKKLALKNISLNNPSQNPDFELPLNKLNALPTLPNTINKIPISKINYVQSNSDIDDFLSQINEADKTLQMLSVVVNNVDVLKGGSENDDEYDDNSGFMKRWEEKYKKRREQEEEKINRQEDLIRERLQEIEDIYKNNKPDNKTPGDKRNHDEEDEYEDEDEDDYDSDEYAKVHDETIKEKEKLDQLKLEYEYLNSFNDIYDNTNANEIINQFKILETNKNNTGRSKGVRTKAIKYLKENFFNDMNLTDNQVINQIPDNIKDFPSKKDYEKDKNKLLQEINFLDREIKMNNENKNLENQKSKLEEENKSIKDNVNIIDFFKSKEPIINGMSKFNSQMNRLYVFFKGKIKPNLKIINQKDIGNALQDMMTLISNFKDIYSEIEGKFHNVFGVERLSKTTKADQFLTTLQKNFINISSDIISNLKSYSSIGTFSEGNNILQVNPSGGLLIPNIIRKRLHLKNKYLL
jgi:hypothetical protein